MSEKVYVRRCEKYTVWEATEPVEVDVEKLRKCNPPYEGNSHQELLEYLEEHVIDGWDFLQDENNKEVYGDENLYELSFEDCEYTPYSDSREKFGDYWTDLGVPNETWRKMGGFEVYENTLNPEW